MKLQYISLLKKQYLSAKGIASFGTSKEHDKYFIEWMKQREISKEFYKNFLLLYGLDYNYRTSAEIGKGAYDCLSSEFEDSVIVTKYTDLFKKNKFNERLIPGTMYIKNKTPYAFVENAKRKSRNELFLNDVDLFYTQNVYFESELSNFVRIHNTGKTILVGAYGKLGDRDRVAKIEQLRNLKEQLVDGKYKDVYVYSDDNYSYFLYTDPNRYPKKFKRKSDYVMIKER